MPHRFRLKVDASNRTVHLFLALMIIGLSLRSPLVAITPIVHDMARDMHASLAAIGLLSSIPLLCFGVLAPMASRIIARLGIERSFMFMAVGAAAGILIRPAGNLYFAILGTIVIGASLAVGNIVSLMQIARDFPGRKAVVTSCFTAASILGTVLTSAFTAPMAEGLGWRPALAVWALLAVYGAYLWWQLRPSGPHDAPVSGRIPLSATPTKKPVPPGPLWSRPVVQLLTVIFSVHLFIIFGLLAWYPAFLIQMNHMSASQAGFGASAMQLMSFGGAFLSPLLVRCLSLPRQLLVIGVFWLIALIWMLVAPGQWLLWSALVGFNQGAGFVVVFTLVMQHARDVVDSRRIAAAVQGVGYTIAAVSPVALGMLLQHAHTWTLPLGALAVLSLVLIGASMFLSRLPPSA